MFAPLNPVQADAKPIPLHLWEGMKSRFPHLRHIAVDAIWMLSFHTKENTKRLLLLHYNGDIEGQLK